LGDVAHLRGQVVGHGVDRVGQVLPGAGHAGHDGLTAEAAFGADLAGDARDLAGEGAQLVHHGVDGFLELQDLAAHVGGDLLGEIARGHGDGDLSDVAHLGGEVAGHQVDVVGEVLPDAADLAHLGLATQPAFGADLAGHARDLAGEGVELVHHGVDGALELENLALDVHRDLAGEVAAGDGGGDVGDVAHLGGEVAAHGVDRVGQILPGAGHAGHDRLAAEPALGADLAGDAGDLAGEGAELIHHRVDGFLELEDLAAGVHRDLFGQVARGYGDGDVGDVAHLGGQVAGHQVDVAGEVL